MGATATAVLDTKNENINLQQQKLATAFEDGNIKTFRLQQPAGSYDK